MEDGLKRFREVHGGSEGSGRVRFRRFRRFRRCRTRNL
jgi:hypothetical protein